MKRWEARTDGLGKTWVDLKPTTVFGPNYGMWLGETPLPIAEAYAGLLNIADTLAAYTPRGDTNGK